MGKSLPVLLLFLATAPLAAPARLVAQKQGDQSRLVFTLSAGYAFGRDLWSVGSQPVFLEGLDLYQLDRNLSEIYIAQGLR